jgi:2-polyprenyl-3-methyl-5-hydroxy-6-metoxy-1,4-benzoquinol methylase
VEIVHSLKPRSILEVGSSGGYFLGQFDDRIWMRVGVDINERALSFTRAFYPFVDYRTADVADVSEKFDVVNAIEVVEHIDEETLPKFLQAMTNRLAPGRSLIISVPTVNEPLNSKHFRHYDLGLLQKPVTEAVPETKLAYSECFYTKTWAEIVCRRLTSGLLVRGKSRFSVALFGNRYENL